jgi:hypothetical protein
MVDKPYVAMENLIAFGKYIQQRMEERGRSKKEIG